MSRRLHALSMAALLVALGASIATAEDIASYEVEGDAETSGADPRVAALDEAFARAVTLVLDEVVPLEARSTHRAVLDRELTARARLWVAKFTVKKDRTVDDRRQLEVTVRVDRDKVRAKLAELSIPVSTAAEPSRARSVVMLLRIVEPSRTRATYGAGAEKELPGSAGLASALRAGGLVAKRQVFGASSPRARTDGELPLSDDEAVALAEDGKGDLVLIAGTRVEPPVPVRGLAGTATLVRARARLIERGSRRVVGEGVASYASAASEGAALDAAIERAVVAAMTDVLPPARTSLARAATVEDDEALISEPGVVFVRLPAKTPWGLVVAQQRYLAGAKGVQRAVLRRLSPRGWVLGVTTTESPNRIAQIAKTPPLAGSTTKVRVAGDVVEVVLAGAP